MADSNPAFREIESFNLFSQGNIYTTKVMKQRKSPSEMDIRTQPTSILVGTLKPAKILNIIPKKTYTNESIEENESEGIKNYRTLNINVVPKYLANTRYSF